MYSTTIKCSECSCYLLHIIDVHHNVYRNGTNLISLYPALILPSVFDKLIWHTIVPKSFLFGTAHYNYIVLREQ